MNCKICGYVDEHYDNGEAELHKSTPEHVWNQILLNFYQNKKLFTSNREGTIITCTAENKNEARTNANMDVTSVENTDKPKIRIYAKPNQSVKYSFTIRNNMRDEDIILVGVILGHPQPQYELFTKYKFGGPAHTLHKHSMLKGDDVYVIFKADDFSQYNMPIIFTFQKKDGKSLIIIRELIAIVQDEFPADVKHTKSPYTSKEWEKAEYFFSCLTRPRNNIYKVPYLLKLILPRGLEEKALERLEVSQEIMEKLKLVQKSTRDLFNEDINKYNYTCYFRHLLWWEEIVARGNLRKYNMEGVSLQKRNNNLYALEVPGLAENRPSLMRDDIVLIKLQDNTKVFECIIKDIEDGIDGKESCIVISPADVILEDHYDEAKFDVRFLMSRISMELMHEAISRIMPSKQLCRLFPDPVKKQILLKSIHRFQNRLLAKNPEQRSAVQHILSGTSGRAPYMVFGPPGTGKTITIVEAIIQIVMADSKNRVLVCTDSNMAADHIAVMLLQYKKSLNISDYLIRANSHNRNWNVLPPELGPVSNGTSYNSFYSVSNKHISSYRIVVTTLLHAAKYCSQKAQESYKVVMTHLFVDEAAQALEPATLVPITGLLSPTGTLVLAGDPQQLGPVCISREAKNRGLGVSLMERLKISYPSLYDNNDANYITMLIKNFRSDPDILSLPNEMFYNNSLQAIAPKDELSSKNILDRAGGNKAIIFHALNSREHKMGNAPSYYNEIELAMLKKYIKALINKHKVETKDIGVIAPYIRQVCKMKAWLTSMDYADIEVGTVEAFQGKEKLVILVSTVRANCNLLEYDARYNLGFLVDDNRFNVTLTRAKAKLIIIGNPTCLVRDVKWRKYMDLCKSYGCYFGEENEQVPRSRELRHEIRTRFDKSCLTGALKKDEKVDKKRKRKK